MEAETVEGEVKTVKKTRSPLLPLIFAGLISVTSILALAAIIFLLPVKGVVSAL